MFQFSLDENKSIYSSPKFSQEMTTLALVPAQTVP